ncbi:MAG: peptide deformylase [Candidatus Eisenbacteria bacterium]|uniref:Peptide deformylase n=1 Tax=Eiseniibacteriota bacterium TaxID=2212470 RepID=A0A937X5R8_UNCEI|nr:peptide deformylase [Candidatus Eisenbacteria bacterium]
MAVRRILTYGDPLLERRSAPVAGVDEKVRELVADLLETMDAERGIGLAAPQIGALRRVIVVHPRPEEEGSGRRLALINPEIVAYAGSCVFEEGCLSVPGTYAEVRRPERVRARYFDTGGEERIEEFDGLMARVVQHEIDHLDGVLFVERLAPMRLALLKRKLRGGRAPAAGGPPLR